MSATTELIQKPFDSTFGNYLLHGIEEIYLPETISWWPQTLTWKILTAVLIIFLLRTLYIKYRDWQNNAYRREAISTLQTIQKNAGSDAQVLSQIGPTLKRAALVAYPRRDVASLTGQRWLAFLDNSAEKALFCNQHGKHLLLLSYQAPDKWQLAPRQIESLFTACHEWLELHQSETDKP